MAQRLSWARGLTWALYGFGTAYRFSGDARFLDTAERCADFYIDRSPAHGVPPNDWEEPSPRVAVESSAAAIAASGLLQLAALTRDPERPSLLGLRADDPRYVAFSAVSRRGGSRLGRILKHGSYHERLGLGVDESVMWGEYFFVEALDKLLGAPPLA